MKSSFNDECYTFISECDQGVSKIPTLEQKTQCFNLCVWFGELYLPINLVRMDERTGNGFFLAGEENIVEIYPNGKWRYVVVKALTLFPLLRLAGFYRSPIKLSLEEEIGRISIVDEDIDIWGRMDILSVNKTQSASLNAYFWVLVIEAKNSEIAPNAGLAQLLTYAYKSLEHQDSVWGLTTNGSLYQFVYLQKGNPSTYQLMPILNLFEPQPSIQLLQVLKAICKLP